MTFKEWIKSLTHFAPIPTVKDNLEDMKKFLFPWEREAYDHISKSLTELRKERTDEKSIQRK